MSEQKKLDFLAGDSEMAKRMREFDFSDTPLGPVSDWPQSLRSAVNICLTTNFPIVLFWGPQLAVLYNDAYIPMLADKHPWALGQTCEAVWNEIFDVIGPLLWDVMKTGVPFSTDDFLFIMQRKGYKEETHFQFSYGAARDESGAVGGIFCVAVEITERVFHERRLAALSNLKSDAKNTMEAAEDAARILDGHAIDMPFSLVYLLSNDGKTANLAGRAGLPAGSKAAPVTVDLTAANENGWPLAQVAANGETALVSDLQVLFGKIPACHWPDPPHSAAVLPLMQPGQKAAGLLVLGISPRRAFDDAYRRFFELASEKITSMIASADAFEQERRRAEALAELDRAKTTFFSNVSHEFRTPLTLMLGPMEELLTKGDAGLPAEEREQVSLAHRNGLRLLKLVNTLLDFSRIEAGRIQASYEPTDIANYTAELASVFRSAIEKAGLYLKVDCAPLPEPVYVDRDMWEKIVLNLLSNAFKFTFEGEITISLRWCGDHAELIVADTGVGIPENELPRLFERFHRVEGTKGRTYEGTGIGLALVQELVKLHGGTIGVQSQSGSGSTFAVSIPAGSKHLPQDRINAKSTLSSTATGANPFIEEALRWLPDKAVAMDNNSLWQENDETFDSYHPETGRSCERILVIDDNADMRSYLQRILNGRWVVELASDGPSALEAIHNNPPDIVLADIMMPGMDGIELLRRIRENPVVSGIPVIFLSARAGEEARVEGLNEGADDYLVKPFSAGELLARVAAHLDIARIRREATEQIRQSEEKYRMLFENMTEMFQVLEPIFDDEGNAVDFRYVQINEASKKLVGEKGNEIEGRTAKELWGIVEDYWLKLLGDVLKTGNAAHMENYSRELDAYYDLYAWKASDKRVAIVFSNITERKRSEEALRESEENKERLLALMDHNPSLVFLKDEEGRYVYLNKAYEKSFIPSGNWYGKTDFDFWPKESAELFRTNDAYVLSSGQTMQFTEDSTDMEGKRYCWLNYKFPFTDSNNLKYVGGIGIDATRLIQAEEALRESEIMYRTVVETSGEGIVIAKPQGNYFYVNQRFADMIGYTADELLGKSSTDLSYEQEHAKVMQARKGLNKGDQLQGEFKFRRKDGSLLWTMYNATPVFNDAGEHISNFVMHTDITEKKKAEEALRLHSSIVESAEAAIFAVDANQNVLSWNKGAQDLYGWRAEEAIGQHLTQLFTPIRYEGGVSREKAVQDYMENGSWQGEASYQRKDGSVIDVMANGRVMKDENGKITSMFIIHTNITERKKMEEALRESEERFRAVQENSLDLFTILKPFYDERGEIIDFTYIHHNARAAKFIGRKPEELAGLRVTEVYPTAPQTSFFAMYKRVAETGQVIEFEDCYNRDGLDDWFRTVITPIPDGIAVAAQIITERKRSEEERERLLSQVIVEREKLQAIISSIDDEVWISDAEGNLILLNPAAQKAHCLRADGKPISEIVDSLEILEADGTPRMPENTPILRALKGETVTGEEFIRHSNTGELRYRRFSCAPVRDHLGNITGTVAVAHDITEEKRAEEALRESEEKYRSIFDSIDEGFCIYEVIHDGHGKPADLRWVEVNPAYEKQTGLKDTVGKLASDVMPGTEDYWLEIYDHVAKTGEAADFENWHEPTGRWYRVFASRIGGAQSGRVAVVFEDITERKKIEETLRESKERQTYLLKLSDALRPLADPVKIQQTAMELIGKQLGAHRAFYGEMLDDEDTLLIGTGYADTVAPLEGYVKFSEFDSDMVTYYRQGKTVVINDIATSEVIKSDHTRTAMQAIQDVAAVGVPLLKDGKVKGILSIHQSHPRKWTSAEISLIEETAERTWAAVERAKAEQALRESEERYMLINTLAPFAICLMRYPEITIEQANVAYERMFGLNCGEAIGKTPDELGISLDPVGRAKMFSEVSKHGSVHAWELEYATRSGEKRFGSFSFNLIEIGRQRYMLGTGIDITERKRMDVELRESEKKAIALVSELEKADRNKNEFISVLSHELRNPLAAISAGVQILDMTQDINQTETAKKIMKRQTNQLCKLVDDLLEVTRISQNKIKLKKEYINLNEIVKSAVEDIRFEFEKKHIKLETKIQTDPILLNADPVRINQAIGNILFNALKFTQVYGVVWLTLKKDKDHAVISVEDNGKGIGSEVLQHLFAPFTQDENTLDRNGSGLGLGLSIVKGIVDLHEGSVSAHSEGLGKGSTFTIRLPIITGNNLIVEKPIPCNIEKTRLKLLLIEDNRDFVDLLNTMLSTAGYSVYIAYDGINGVKLAKQIKPDVIFCDIGLPGLNGYEVAENIRNYNDLRGIKLIALTGYAGEGDIERALKAGYNKHLAKPVDFTTLQNVLKE